MKPSVLFPALCLAALPAMGQTPCSVPRPDAKYTGPVHRGQVLDHPTPPYPGGARAHGISGTVIFRAHILDDGTVGHLTPLSGPPELQESAEKTLYRWRYTPWTSNGQPVDAYTTMPVSFGLHRPDGATGSPPKLTGQKISPLELQGLLVRSYPSRRSKKAVKANLSGTVQLHVMLDETGRIADLGVVCGAEALEDAALETVRHWRYHPYLSNEQPVAVESTIDVTF
jgi:TonB family protein